MRSSALLLLTAAAITIALTATSPLRLVGDGPEYLAMAQRISRGSGPSLSTDDARAEGLEYRELRTSDGRQVLPHFWLYSAFVAPFMAGARLLGLNEMVAFTWANAALLVASACLAIQSFGAVTLAFLFLGPILWWIDKAHTEVFAYALLIAVSSQLSRRPTLALLAAGLLAAQNPQALVFFACVVPVILLHLNRQEAAPGRVGLAVAGAVSCAMSYGGYYLWRIGRWTPLVEARDLRLPAIKTAGAVIWDLNIGLAIAAPLAVLVVATSAAWAIRKRGISLAPEWLCILLWLPLLFSFAQTMNVNHGGTPGMSRYALWLLPLAAPLVDVAAKPLISGGGGKIFLLLVSASTIWNVVYFAPSRPEGFLEPTAIARYQWLHFPDLLDPLPEIFAERVRHQESVNVFAATETCSKALLQSGQWPAPCAPSTAPIPPECRDDGALCFANRTDSGYVFHHTSRRGGISIPLPTTGPH